MSDTKKVEVCFEIDKSLLDILKKQAIQEKIALESLMIDAFYKRIPKMRGGIKMAPEICTVR
jgi:hypothetical protein